jgi:hypothetical protein
MSKMSLGLDSEIPFPLTASISKYSEKLEPTLTLSQFSCLNELYAWGSPR